MSKLTHSALPLVSVFMPVYNSATYLTQAIHSLQRQTYRDWELIVVDDASQDNSFKIAQELAKNDTRIKVYHNQHNLGTSATSNKAITLARGQYLAKMDSDDIAINTRLSLQVRFLQANSDVVAVGGQCVTIDEQNHVVGQKRFPTQPEAVRQMLFSFASLQHPAMMVNRALLPKRFHWYDAKTKTAEEHELLFKLLQFGHLANLSETVLRYRFHGQNNSTKTPKLDFYIILRARLKAVRHYHYQPTPRAAITLLVQTLVVSLLPTSLIHPLYAAVRGLKPISFKRNLASKTESKSSKKLAVTQKLDSLSVFFPMHNEENNILTLIKSAMTVIPTLAKKYEIIIVNDGSTDHTSQIAHQLAKHNIHLRVIDQENKGYGGALQTGFSHARYNWIFFSDGDLQFDLRELSKFVPFTHKYSVVLGFRQQRADSTSRAFLALLLKIWNACFFQLPPTIKDIDCAFKLFHRSVVEDIFPLESQGAMISSEIILKILDKKHAFVQVGVTHLARRYGQQTGAHWNVVRGAVKETFKLFYIRNVRQTYLAKLVDIFPSQSSV